MEGPSTKQLTGNFEMSQWHESQAKSKELFWSERDKRAMTECPA